MKNLTFAVALTVVVVAGAPAAAQVAGRGAAPAAPAANEPAALAASRPDLALLDQTSLAVGVFEVGTHWRGKEGANLDLLCSAHPVIFAAEPYDLARRAGISPKRVERVLMVMGRGRMIFATTFSDPEASAAIRRTQFPAGTLEAVGDHRILLGGPNGLAGYELTDRIFVVGDAPEIRTIAGPPTPPTSNPLIQGFRGLLAREKPLLALQLDAASLGPRLQADFEPHGLAPLLVARAWRLVCVTTDRGLLIQLAAQFDEPAQATAGVEALRNLQEILVGYLDAGSGHMPEILREQAAEYPDGGRIADAFGDAVKRINRAFAQSKPKVGGAMLSVDFRVETETPVSDVICLMTLLPRGAKQP